MKIGIDIRLLSEGKRTGVEGYTLNLLTHLFEIDKENQYKLFFNSFKGPSFDIDKAFNFPNVTIKKTKIPNKLLNLSFILFNYPKISKILDCDIFFAPNISFYSLDKNCKNIITFHDLAFSHYSHFYSLKRRLWHKVVNPRKLARKNDLIIAVSEATKDDLISTYNILENKIKVIYSGLDENLKICYDQSKLEETRKKYNLPQDFILSLGSIEPRKNIVGLISAYEKLRNKNKINNKLVIAGEKAWCYKEIFKVWEKSKYKDDIIFPGFIEEEDKIYLYNLSKLFVYPSFYEGFGFPALEAMACGVPVVTSFVSSLPEVCSDAALLIDPYNIDDLALGVYNGIVDKKLRENLIKKGLERAGEFKWDNCAKEVKKLFSRL
jgi:glycosyltransferase involved in cell wall biosynthesis